MKRIPGRKKLTLVTLVLALGVAVYLNWEYAKSGNELTAIQTGTSTETITVSETAPDSATTQETAAAADSSAENTADSIADKNYGDAQLVSLTKDSGSEYFDEAKLNRSKSRDDALDKLQKSLKNSKLTSDEKQKLTDQLTAMLGDITAESDIESLVKAKGFVDCVAYLDNGTANVAVMTSGDALNKSDVAQIRDIVIAKSSTDAKNITVVEVK